VEQTPDAIAARQAIYEGSRAMSKVDFTTAKDKYEEGLKHWRIVLDAYPQLKNESIVIDELIDIILEYQTVLGHHDLKLPENFVLQDVIDEKNKSPYPVTTPGAQTPGGDVTGPQAEADRGVKKPAAEGTEETPPPAPQ
jgi:hypothetical protein